MTVTLTLKDLKERLAKMEETYLLELLNVDSEMLVERFEDLIEENFDFLYSELEDFREDPDDEEA